jgi:CheY-like chemotaxis protein
MENGKKRLVAVLNDLMFTVKIQEAAKRAGLEPVFVKSKREALEEAKTEPAVIIVDLNNTAADPLELIAELKGAEQTREVRLLGYVSHVQADLKQAAQQKGCDTVMPRSAFSQNLQAILRRYAEA